MGLFVDLEAQVARHERRGHLQKQVVQVVAVLASDLICIAEAARGEQGSPCTLALDDGVGDKRRAVDHVLDLVGWRVRPYQRLGQHFGHGA